MEQEISFANLDLIEQLYAQYQNDPSSIDPSWSALFAHDTFANDLFGKNLFGENLPSTARAPSQAHTPSTVPIPSQITQASAPVPAPASQRIQDFIVAYRTYGHLMADVDPIATKSVTEPWQLQLETLGFNSQELNEIFPTNGLLEKTEAPLVEIIQELRKIYCNHIGYEYMGLQEPEIESWLQQHIESKNVREELSIEQKKMILQHLNKSELFEMFLHTKYVGQKRFSLEGCETLIPVMAAIIETGSKLGLTELILGMAHRGRLNVLSNILNKSYAQIFSEFEEGYIPISFEGSGDVKYHKGFSSVVKTEKGKDVAIILTPNPSHLESVDPVVLGQTLAKQKIQAMEKMPKAEKMQKYPKIEKSSGEKKLSENAIDRTKIVPVLVHGDAALSGQGIIYETLQLHDLQGYSTGGTLHIVINNQIGFTTLPQDGRSTYYCTDIAKTFGAPVFHVNAEDPESCIFVTNLAIELRQKFQCDVFIDLNGYRKYGHNEGDEPAFTQPIEYSMIHKKKSIREIYRDYLIQQGILERKIAESLEQEFKESLQNALTGFDFSQGAKKDNTTTPNADADIGESKGETKFTVVNTAVSREMIELIGNKLSVVPEGLTIHKKLERLIADRLAMVKGEKPIDWGMGETLAYGTLLLEGKNIRLSGQDCCRGTFSHRHVLWMDQVNGLSYYPLQHIKDGQGQFEVYNSPLSEYAILGFEFGYSLAAPESLVIWEAQFGDFCNGAQIIIDQYIATAEMKWGQKNGIVLLLPHGYEGQGPEHSSGRMERFLTLCGNNNMVVANPTTPAQLFHLLRRQLVKPMKKPLIVFTPKGLLRHPECVSRVEDLVAGAFQEIIDDIQDIEDADDIEGIDDPNSQQQIDKKNKVKKMVFCTGRIYYDLINERKKRNIEDMAIIRIEQLYPLHVERLSELIKSYIGVTDYYWVQEEPDNMGAWGFIRPFLQEVISVRDKGEVGLRGRLKYVGRNRSASPAAGSFALHKKEHGLIIQGLFGD